MKKVLALLLAIAVAGGSLSGCIRTDYNKDKIKFLASFYPIYIMALNIVDGVDDVEVDCMAEVQVGCLHDFKLSTDDMRNIEKSDGFIINGAGMEGFIEDIANKVDGLQIIDSSTGIDLLADGHHHDEDEHEHEDEHDDEHIHEDEHEHEGHNHGEYNAHIWVSVANCIKQVENITDGIVKLDPAHESEYRSNSKKYISKLTELKNEMESGLADISDRNIITFHEAFDYFAEEFKLNIVSVIEREPGSEPNARDLASIIDLTKETGVKALFVEPQYPNTSADIIAAETDAKVYTLDPGVSGEMNKDAYIKMMKENLKVLQKALD